MGCGEWSLVMRLHLLFVISLSITLQTLINFSMTSVKGNIKPPNSQNSLGSSTNRKANFSISNILKISLRLNMIIGFTLVLSMARRMLIKNIQSLILHLWGSGCSLIQLQVLHLLFKDSVGCLLKWITHSSYLLLDKQLLQYFSPLFQCFRHIPRTLQ